MASPIFKREIGYSLEESHMRPMNPIFDLYFWPTPNGYKISIMLEELGVDYQVSADQYH